MIRAGDALYGPSLAAYAAAAARRSAAPGRSASAVLDLERLFDDALPVVVREERFCASLFRVGDDGALGAQFSALEAACAAALDATAAGGPASLQRVELLGAAALCDGRADRARAAARDRAAGTDGGDRAREPESAYVAGLYGRLRERAAASFRDLSAATAAGLLKSDVGRFRRRDRKRAGTPSEAAVDFVAFARTVEAASHAGDRARSQLGEPAIAAAAAALGDFVEGPVAAASAKYADVHRLESYSYAAAALRRPRPSPFLAETADAFADRASRAGRRYAAWMFAYAFPKLVAYFAKLETLVETRGPAEARIHEPEKTLAALKQGLASPRLEAGLKSLADRLDKHFVSPAADPALRSRLRASVFDHAAATWASFDALARAVYDEGLEPGAARFRSLLAAL